MPEPDLVTKQDLDGRLSRVTSPGPVIHIGPAFPIDTFLGYNDPFPGWYRGARVVVDEELMDQCFVEEIPFVRKDLAGNGADRVHCSRG